MSESTQPRALVTGASRGIGRAIAVALARKGVRVAVHCSSRYDLARETQSRLAGSGHFCIQADLSEAFDRKRLMDQIEETWEGLDILVNNAGIFHETPLEDRSLEAWRKSWSRTISINLDAPAELMFQAFRLMRPRQKGRIINITSRGAFRGEPRAPEYGASKSGLNACSQSFAVATAPYGIQVFAVAPGFVETDMVASHLSGPHGDAIRAQSPMNRAAAPQEIGNMVAYLALEAPDYLSGAIIDINGASYLRN